MGSGAFKDLLRKKLEDDGLIPPLSKGADRLGVTQPTLSKWLSGREVPRDDKLEVLTEFLDLPLERAILLLAEARRERSLAALATINDDGSLDLHLTPLESAEIRGAIRAALERELGPEARARLERLVRELDEAIDRLPEPPRGATQRLSGQGR